MLPITQCKKPACAPREGAPRLDQPADGVEGAPKPVKEGVNKDEAAKIKKQLEDAGATVEVK